MKQRNNCLTIAIGLTTAVWTSGALADDNNGESHDSTGAPFDYFHCMEFSADGFAVGTAGEDTLEHSFRYVRHHAGYGAGVGGNFSFTKYFGIGGEFYTENSPGPWVASTSGNLIARLPIKGTPLAPYVFGGGGHDFDGVQQSFGQAGGGLEVRFMRHVGVFVDARYVFAGQTDNYAMGRAGVRISF